MKQTITLQFPLSRADMKPDNTPLRAVATIAEWGFKVIRASVHELRHSMGVEQSLELVCTPPYRSRGRWVPLLVSAGQALSLHDMDIDDGSGD